jgi:hypothetical protein
VGGGLGGYDFIWNLEDDNVAHVIGNGLEATLWGRNAGQSFLTVSHYGFSKKILVICVENANDIENIFYFTSDKTYFRIKKNEEARIALLFGKNGFPEDEKKKIEWKEDLNNNVISLSSLGESAKITGKNSGVAKIIVSHELVNKDMEILVEVVDSVTGSEEYYMLFPTVNKMILGVPQTIPVSLYKDDHLYAQGYGLLTAETEGKGIVQAELLNDTLRILGRREGREYITLSHPLAGQRRILAVVYEGQIPDDEPVIYAEKQYWSVYEGREETITLQITGGDEHAQNGILWTNFDPLVISVDSSRKTTAKIKGMSFGSTEVDILLNGNLMEKLYVSVAKGNVNTDIVVSTESIIIMALDTDTSHRTKVIGSGNTLECNWHIENEKIAEIYGFADQCALYPVSAGVTELTVSGNNYERKIIVIVVNTEKEKMEARWLNVDKRYYKLKRGESTVIFPYYKTKKPETQANAPLLHYNSGVVSATREGEGFVITGKNEGIELITIVNIQCGNSIQITVEVSNTISGGVVENNNLVYMTTENNIIMARPGTYGLLAKIDLIGEYQGTNADFIWSKDSILIEWEASGTLAFINAGNKAGEVNITVENNYCQYPLKIKIIIQEDYETTASPYVYADRTVYQLALSDDVLRAGFKVNNINEVDYSQVVFTKTGNAVDFNLNGNYFEARPRTQGVSEVELGYPGAVPLKIFFIVSDNVENTAVYLTTAMNYVVVPKSKTKVIDISLVNYVELNADNIKWASSDYGTVTVVGVGMTVQAYGVEIGFAKLTVKHPASYNDLEILVKVIDELEMSNIAYLTTSDNIIETFVQNNTLQVSVNKIGGKLPELETVWTVDNPSIVSVMGSGNIGYLVPKKAGIAKVTVTERETEKLDIVVIVKEVKAGTEYITTDEPVVQMNPGVLNHTIRVSLVGGNELDSQQFEWQVYSQLPSDYEVAKNGGTVISLFGMGDRAAISGNYVGTARVRVSHPKAQLPLYIAVQVTNHSSLSFNEREAIIINGEIYFAGIRVPNYENFTGKVEYSTDNPAVCVVTGSDKVALLQSQGVGKANITAVVRGTSLQASIAVSVIERDNFAEPNIIVPKTTYLLNPRERPFQVEAYLQGAGVTEEMRYGVKWEAMLYNGSDQGSVWDAIAIYPSETAEKPAYSGGENIKVLRGTGPIIQIEVLNPLLPQGRAFQTKEIVIVVSQPEITSRTKTIYIRISEVSGIFTLSKSEIMMETFDTADLSCGILGGRDSDYKEVVWVAETDNAGRKVVSLLSDSGKDIKLFGQNDGTVYVTAIYRNEIAECRVQVKSNVYLKLQYDIFFTYPGARNGSNQLIEVEYEVRPFTTQVMWTPVGQAPDANNPSAIITPVTQDYSTGKGKIRIDPLNEGLFTLTGIGLTNSRTVNMTIIIQNVYRIQIPNKILNMQLGRETEYNDPKPKPEIYWDYDNKYNAKTELVDNWYKIGDSIYLPFVICPPDHRLVFSDDAVKLMTRYGIGYEISPVVKYGEMEGRGIIRLKVNKEIPSDEYSHANGLELTLDLKKPFENEIINPSLYSSNPSLPNNSIYIKSQLQKQQTAIVPVFQRVHGKYTNPNALKYKYYDPLNPSNNYNNPQYKYLTDEKDISSLFDINHSPWRNFPTGVLSEFNNADYYNSTSEYLPLFKDGAKQSYYNFDTNGHSVAYDLEIGDGEEHYILLDKTHEGMYYEFDRAEALAAVQYLNNEFKKLEFYGGKASRAPTVELANINGGTAIRIKGGDDFTVYDRVLVKNRKKFSFMSFSGSGNVNQRNYDVSEKTDIYNDKKNLNQFNEDIGGLPGAADYYLVKKFGIPLNIYDNIIDYDNGYVDEAVLNTHVRNQIVYLRKANPTQPIRVQYNYGPDGSGGVGTQILIAEKSGASITFTNAKEFFQEGPLYVSKADGRGNYPYGNVTGKINAYMDYFNSSNPVNGTQIPDNDMKNYNPHFDDKFYNSLYIVSDFDLGEEGAYYYYSFADTVYNIAFPNDTSGSTGQMYITYGDFDMPSYIQPVNFSYVKAHFNLRYNFPMFTNNTTYNGYHYSGVFLNYNNARKYFYAPYHTGNLDKYAMFMNENSLFKGKPGFINILHDMGPCTPSGFSSNYDARWINYRAMIEAVKHNAKEIQDQQLKDFFINKTYNSYLDFKKEFEKNINLYHLITSISNNERGFFLVFSTEGLRWPNYSEPTLYVKKELEKDHNKVYSLADFQMNNPVSGFEFHAYNGAIFYKDKKMITEDITGNENYAPVVTAKSNLAYASKTVPLTLKYKNSYNDKNTITINIKHMIRSDHNSGESDQAAEWKNVIAVDQIYGYSNFNKLYGYFFIDKEYATN